MSNVDLIPYGEFYMLYARLQNIVKDKLVDNYFRYSSNSSKLVDNSFRYSSNSSKLVDNSFRYSSNSSKLVDNSFRYSSYSSKSASSNSSKSASSNSSKSASSSSSKSASSSSSKFASPNNTSANYHKGYHKGYRLIEGLIENMMLILYHTPRDLPTTPPTKRTRDLFHLYRDWPGLDKINKADCMLSYNHLDSTLVQTVYNELKCTIEKSKLVYYMERYNKPLNPNNPNGDIVSNGDKK
ncbi:17583_t:CDS:2 [Racocetra fulgida]|uniref:17583_t:CDS:1 n=1 Tax=Racocetra fulgida TaxID=60492 RepID=A0A9N9D192_9GLOM|nr:17583_t:CDS:2 [Racocetra fulgida]